MVFRKGSTWGHLGGLVKAAALSLFLTTCASSQVLPETIDFERDRLWRTCRLHVVDRVCGMLSSESERSQCAISTQAEYISIDERSRRVWLRSRSCPRDVVSQ